jgi:iron complex outermembrane receptor protein
MSLRTTTRLRRVHRAVLILAALSQTPALPAQRADSTARAAAADSARRIEGVLVTAVRAAGTAPISAKTIDRATIERRNFGQDLPLLLQGAAPSLTAYSETGSPWGYSYFRSRGIDQSRINLTIDGIPLNDPEDHVLYFADFPDLANSLQTTQVQRGVGTSSAGTAAFAGSINFESLPLSTGGREGELQLQAGSFGSRRGSLEYRSGLMPNRFAYYARVSGLSTDGYRHHSGVSGRSGFVSAGYFGQRDIVKVMATMGTLRDTLAYLGVSESELSQDRRANPLTPQERDAFGEQLAALSYTRLVSGDASVSTTVYRISASGDYDVAIDNGLWNFNLDFAWLGLTSAVNVDRGRMRLSAGVNANSYSRDHHAYIRPDVASPLYFNTGHKTDRSAFAKLSVAAGNASLFGDLQIRHAGFRYEPDANAGIAERSIDWTFVNPKVGVTYTLGSGLALYTSYGTTTREPARSDMFAGFDNIDTTNSDFVGPLTRVRPERVGDLEVGTTYSRGGVSLQANVFSMQFTNEIAPIGQLSYIGLPLRKNVPSSYRRGLEVDLSYTLDPRIVVGGNATVMKGRITEYRDSSADAPTTSRNVEPLLTPRLLTTHRLHVVPFESGTVEADVEGRYQSRSYLTNTGDASLVLPPSYLVSGSITWRYRRHAVTARVENLMDSRKFSSGYLDRYSGKAAYYVIPPRSAFVTVKVGF